jgi:DNA-binding Xre family transcriptional regulator
VSRAAVGPGLDFEWKLREVMATRGMFATTDLRPLLAERGVQLSASQVYRLVVDKPERLNMQVLMALLDALGCQLGDLIVPVPLARQARKRRAAGERPGPAEDGIGDLRPRRARVLPTKDG